MTPANDDVATVGRVAMIAEMSALKFEFNPHPLPPSLLHLPLRFAIRETGLDGFDLISKLPRDHAEEEDHTLFVDGFVPKTAKINGVPIGRKAMPFEMPGIGVGIAEVLT